MTSCHCLPQSLPQELQHYLDHVVRKTTELLPHKVVSIILHGSCAMGCFHPPKSDVDILVIVEDLRLKERGDLFCLFKELHAQRPYVGGLEVSAVRIDHAQSPVHPMPFLVHWSEGVTATPSYLDSATLPFDEDLIAHFMVAKHRGFALYGADPRCVIGDMAWCDYVSSVRADIAWILQDRNILSTPFYAVLNLCRWLMMTSSKGMGVVSKEEAGEWGLHALPGDHQEMIAQALHAYRSAHAVSVENRRSAGLDWDSSKLLAFKKYVEESNLWARKP